MYAVHWLGVQKNDQNWKMRCVFDDGHKFWEKRWQKIQKKACNNKYVRGFSSLENVCLESVLKISWVGTVYNVNKRENVYQIQPTLKCHHVQPIFF